MKCADCGKQLDGDARQWLVNRNGRPNTKEANTLRCMACQTFRPRINPEWEKAEPNGDIFFGGPVTEVKTCKGCGQLFDDLWPSPRRNTHGRCEPCLKTWKQVESALAR